MNEKKDDRLRTERNTVRENSEKRVVKIGASCHACAGAVVAFFTCRFWAGAGMGRMVAVSVTPRGTGTAWLLLISVAPLPDSAA
jgi:hypothetical protein